MFRVLRPYQYAVDAFLAVAYLLCSVAVLGSNQSGVGYAGYFVLLGYAAALGVRRINPTLALSMAWFFSLLQMIVGMYPNLYNVATLMVLYTTSAYGGRVIRWVGLASVGLGAFIAAAYLTLGGSGMGVSLTLLGWSDLPLIVLQFAVLFGGLLTALGGPWLLGLLVRAVIRNRESTAARQVAEEVVIVEQERNRIARDMHDVVAHSLAVVVAQADGARYARAANPEAVDESLIAISTTAREALADVRLLLSQLRYSEGDGPQPVLADLDRLLDQMRASGLTISFAETGQSRYLGTGQQLALYRIVQEALTNALRHGQGEKPVTVTFDWAPSSVDVTIENTIEGTVPSVSLGHGLAGMRERAALVGGWLTAEPTGQRFVVTASVPTNQQEIRA
ncbi:sensor histidine kinase [Glaciihabitans arcticus]|uniref:histidine kinase n=1 Tax=Glaciihabitans arcticus TaxID=2668039 RepID=A0A4Q9GQ42_9MICO|nr:histidine kinase [Glaciihabitans arcticus]TBN56956.1 sensor histidine kinase [Glaciihabitans arcticus]